MSVRFDPERHIYTVDGEQLPSVTEVCRFCAYDYKSDRPWLAEAAARRGSAVHEACALIDFGEEPEETPELAGYLKAYRRFLADCKPDWELIEHPMGDASLGFAGTLDRYGTIDGVQTLLDIKTGTVHTAAVSAQLAGYRSLLFQERGSLVFAACALKLSRDGTYDLSQIVPNSDLFRACFRLHHYATEKGKKR